MSDTFCEIWDGRFDEGDWRTGQQRSRIFDVTMAAGNADPQDVYDLIGIAYGDSFSSRFPLLLATNGRAVQGTGQFKKKWQVTYQYNNKLDFPEAAGGPPGTGATASDPHSTPPNPADRAAQWRFSSVLKKKARRFDLTGKPLVNEPFGQPILPPIESEIPLLNIRVRKAYSITAIGLNTFADDFRGHCNDATWHGLAQYSVKVDDVTGESAWENGRAFYWVDWSFIHDIDLWYPTKILNTGTKEKIVVDGGDTKIVPMTEFGLPVTQAMPIKADGTRVAIGAPTADFYYLEFDLVPRVNFATIPGV